MTEAPPPTDQEVREDLTALTASDRATSALSCPFTTAPQLDEPTENAQQASPSTYVPSAAVHTHDTTSPRKQAQSSRNQPSKAGHRTASTPVKKIGRRTHGDQAGQHANYASPRAVENDKVTTNSAVPSHPRRQMLHPGLSSTNRCRPRR